MISFEEYVEVFNGNLVEAAKFAFTDPKQRISAIEKYRKNNDLEIDITVVEQPKEKINYNKKEFSQQITKDVRKCFFKHVVPLIADGAEISNTKVYEILDEHHKESVSNFIEDLSYETNGDFYFTSIIEHYEDRVIQRSHCAEFGRNGKNAIKLLY